MFKNIKKYNTAKLIILFGFLFLSAGSVFAQPVGNQPTTPSSSLVPCTNTATQKTIDPITKKEILVVPDTDKCNWDSLLKLISKVVKFILFAMAVPIAAIMFASAGFMLVTSGGDPGKKSRAKEIFGNVFFGIIIAIAAWLIIHTVLRLLGYQGSWIGF